MPSIVDLTGKDTAEDGAEASARKESTRRERTKKTSTRRTVPTEADLKGRLAACIDRIAAAAEVREDEELAEILHEDRDIIVNGLVSLTRPFRALRAPLVVLLAIIEPVMAFTRIGRLMLERVMTRKTRVTRSEDSQPAQWDGAVQ